MCYNLLFDIIFFFQLLELFRIVLFFKSFLFEDFDKTKFLQFENFNFSNFKIRLIDIQLNILTKHIGLA